MKDQNGSWFRTICQYRGSVIPAVWRRVLLCALFGTGVSILHQLGWNLFPAILGNVIPTIVLGLLLVFRTNTAYERYWEGRKLWGMMINSVRNLSRQLWVVVVADTPQERTRKIAALRLLIAFAIATKLYLRQEPVNHELAALITRQQYEHLQRVNHPPLKIAFWLEDYLQQQYRNNKVNIYQLTYLDALVDKLVESLGGCERILKTPIPLAYSIHLKQILLLFCLLLPFQVVGELELWTGLIVGLISFTLFGVEEIGTEIENPFGKDLNDLPLDTICATMQRNIEDLIQSPPGSALPMAVEVPEV
ncbi:MAG: hypothetical protein KME35_06220 [Aphanocapsa sp. GSE-SYN-MK-11-07L]|jgi:putative membrane protein|nr:hypothetical protein [Aphanocapsa sp. GSE-SYN-MK-11-07L]